MICLAPRDPGEIVGPRRPGRAVGRPLNFTVRRLDMPRTVRVSLWLLLAGVAAGFALAPFEPTPWPATPPMPVLIATIVLGAALFGALAFVALRTYQGRNWARWLQLALLAVVLPGAVRHLLEELGSAPAVTLIHAAILCAQIASVALLFTPTSNSWYRDASRKSPAS